MDSINESKPWVTFCMTTYKRPEFLKKQLLSLSNQTFSKFNVVICDNDPKASAEMVVNGFNDRRFSYYHNIENLGMIRSFNKSIEKAHSPYIVMLTDDDHVDTNMLSEFRDIEIKYPGYPIYLGCKRSHKSNKEIEIFDNENYLFQLLHPELTQTILWSSCLLETSVVQKLGGIPDFGSPHFADHALLAGCAKYRGGVFINKMYGSLASHDQNFSKSHFDLYFKGCIGFYEYISSNFDVKFYKKKNVNALEKHLHTWFLNNYFILKKYFTYKNYQKETLNEIDTFSKNILGLSFMKSVLLKFRIRQLIFLCKKPLYLLKYHR
jgi:glycosyltransferase involved in cell wall biosynthesis